MNLEISFSNIYGKIIAPVTRKAAQIEARRESTLENVV